MSKTTYIVIGIVAIIIVAIYFYSKSSGATATTTSTSTTSSESTAGLGGILSAVSGFFKPKAVATTPKP